MFHQKKMIRKKLRKMTIAFNVLDVKKEKIYPTYVSEHNSNCVKQVLMISNGEGWITLQ